MEEQTPDKFLARQSHRFCSIISCIVLVSESDSACLGIDSLQPCVSDGNPMSVAAQIIEDALGAHNRTLGKDVPALGGELSQQLGKALKVL